MFDHSGFGTKRRSPSCTCQTTRSTADHKIIVSFNCFRHHEAKRQTHLSGNYESLKPNTECLRDSGSSRCHRSFWTEINRLETREFLKNKMATKLLTMRTTLFENSNCFCAFLWSCLIIFTSQLEIPIFLFVQVRTGREKAFFRGTWEFVYFAGFVAKRNFFVVILIGDLLLIAVQEKGQIEFAGVPETYFIEKYQNFARSWGFITPPVWKSSWSLFTSFTVLGQQLIRA